MASLFPPLSNLSSEPSAMSNGSRLGSWLSPRCSYCRNRVTWAAWWISKHYSSCWLWSHSTTLWRNQRKLLIRMMATQLVTLKVRMCISSCSVIVRVSVVLKRTVGDSDWRFDNLSGRHLQSHCDIVPSVDGIYVSGYWPDWSVKLSCYWL